MHWDPASDADDSSPFNPTGFCSRSEKYRVSPNVTLQDWREKIGRLCLNNSRLMFAVSLAFTGPILRFVRAERSGGFEIYGSPETGKTTAAMVAGSVWGCHRQPDKGFLESWNTTANAVEVTALAHNDGLLILDETKAQGNVTKRLELVLNVTMRLAEQREKKRLGGATEPRSWRFYFLSTSNFSLDEMAAKAGSGAPGEAGVVQSVKVRSGKGIAPAR